MIFASRLALFMVTIIYNDILGLQRAIDAMEKNSTAGYFGTLAEEPDEVRAAIKYGIEILGEAEAFLKQASA